MRTFQIFKDATFALTIVKKLASTHFFLGRDLSMSSLTGLLIHGRDVHLDDLRNLALTIIVQSIWFLTR